MYTLLLVVSALLIILVLLQSGKAESAGNIITGNNDLFSQRKERGSELVISRITLVLGIIFFVICLVQSFLI